MADVIDQVRSGLSDRAELPGMTLMEHLEELRKRLIRSVAFLVVGFVVAYAFHERLYGIIQKPLDDLHIPLNFTHPTDGLNLYLKTAFLGGAIIAAPFILYQVWLFISPGLYQNEKKYVFPFILAVILGLGICFELPVIMFFLALFGIADGKFFLKQYRYAILVIFLVSAIICPLPDPVSRCLFASPMLALYILGVVVAYFVHPSRRKAKELKS
jgi:sec-independent protein translocase protein TatC